MGAQKLDEVLLWCNGLGIPAVTLWVCSTENLKRSHAEVSVILGAIEAKIGALAHDPWIHQRRVRVKAAGRLSLLPPSTVTVIRKAEEATADYDAMTLTIAVAYGGLEEIADAVRGVIRAKVRDGLRLDEVAEHVTPRRSISISTRPGSQIPTSLSARAARCVCLAFCYSKAPTANSASRTSTGRSSAKSTSCARSARSSRGRYALGSEAATG
jgi:undecaprenyl diphosphate synthase